MLSGVSVSSTKIQVPSPLENALNAYGFAGRPSVSDAIDLGRRCTTIVGSEKRRLNRFKCALEGTHLFACGCTLNVNPLEVVP